MNKASAPTLPASQMTTYMPISNLGQLWSPSAFPNELDFGSLMCHSVLSISAFTCISKSTPSLLAAASLHSLYLWHEVHLQSHSIIGFKYIFKLTVLWPSSVSLSSHDYRLHVHAHVLSIGASRCSSNYIWARLAAKFTIRIDMVLLW